MQQASARLISLIPKGTDNGNGPLKIEKLELRINFDIVAHD